MSLGLAGHLACHPTGHLSIHLAGHIIGHLAVSLSIGSEKSTLKKVYT